MFKSYEIDKSKIDKPTFFRSLAKYFPDATTLYLGGDEIMKSPKMSWRAMNRTKSEKGGIWLTSEYGHTSVFCPKS